jgi:hypothetical protein
LSRAYENKVGENLNALPSVINILFNDPICVSDVLVQQIVPKYNTSNVAQIQVSYNLTNGTQLKTPDGKLFTIRSSDNLPAISETPMRCDIQGIDVTILKTFDKNLPSWVRLKVMGCYGQSKRFLFKNIFKHFF